MNVKFSYWESQAIRDYFTAKEANPLAVESLAKVGQDINSVRSVLDVGCGYGRNLIPFATRRCKIYCFDPCRAAIDYTRQRFNLPENTCRLACMSDRPWDGMAFDFIICDGVLHQLATLDEMREALDYLSNVTVFGGYVFLSIFTSDTSPGCAKNIGGNLWKTEAGIEMLLLTSTEIMNLCLCNGLAPVFSASEQFVLNVGTRNNLTCLLNKGFLQ